LKLSVITPNYNYEEFISQTILSVVLQDIADLEHIIVDDGSTDNSVAVINNLIKQYPNRIKLITQENQGQTKAINNGLKAASGDIICWLNSDDMFIENSLKKVLTEFERNDEIDVIIGNAEVIDTNGQFIYKIRHLPYKKLHGITLGFTKITTSNTVFWRKKLMDQTGLMNDTLKCNMDGEYFSRLLNNAKVKFLPLSLSKFRQQPFTKASEKYKNWQKIVQEELALELANSWLRYKTENRIILPKIVYKVFYKIERILLRLLKLHYLYQWTEKKNYVKRFGR
jgi:glycosyltransferase involved in cell wall biosynthesis